MAVHWNGNLMCAIDIETTGLNAEQHEIIQVCVLPLKSNLTPRTDIAPFYTDLAPMKEIETFDLAALRVHKIDIFKLKATGLDPWTVADRFEEWFQKLNLPFRKKILPLAHNWPFEAAFLKSWLGPVSFDSYFYGFRDTMAIANTINDMCDFANEAWKFPKVNLGYLCSQLGVVNDNPHDAFGDCMATAELYRRMVQLYKIY